MTRGRTWAPEWRGDLLAGVARIMDVDPLEILRLLVSIPSVNPMGREEAAAPFGESRLTDCLERLFQELGMRTERHQVLPGRENLYAVLDGEVPPAAGGALLLFDAHQDTVPAEGMTIEPWTPTIRNNRLYGRGACDTKGGMAAMIAALARLSRERPAAMPTILMACTADEEYRLTGAPALVARWRQGRSELIPRAPDVAVVAEPTGLDVIVAHKGVIRWECHTPGRAAHSSRPDLGDNAIYRMARLLTALDRYETEVIPGLASHPLCGGSTLNVGTIRGGTAINLVPDRCCIEVEIRVPPGREPASARKELVEYLEHEESATSSVDHDPPYMLGLPLADNDNGRLAARVADTIRGVTGKSRCRGVPYATNAAFYAQAGTPSVVFGPGAIEQAHTADEWLSLDQFLQATEILYRFAVSFSRA
jgi:acetylornithine deacetylase/succinyl-diaminopimelate desuccinylase family protein